MASCNLMAKHFLAQYEEAPKQREMVNCLYWISLKNLSQRIGTKLLKEACLLSRHVLIVAEIATFITGTSSHNYAYHWRKLVILSASPNTEHCLCFIKLR
jgi:hypothetical protein